MKHLAWKSANVINEIESDWTPISEWGEATRNEKYFVFLLPVKFIKS